MIGPRKTFYFFARKNKLRGSASSLGLLREEGRVDAPCAAAFCFLAGIVLVFVKYPFIGMIIETVGFLNLFGSVPAPHEPREELTATPGTSFRSCFPSCGRSQV